MGHFRVLCPQTMLFLNKRFNLFLSILRCLRAYLFFILPCVTERNFLFLRFIFSSRYKMHNRNTFYICNTAGFHDVGLQ